MGPWGPQTESLGTSPVFGFSLERLPDRSGSEAFADRPPVYVINPDDREIRPNNETEEQTDCIPVFLPTHPTTLQAITPHLFTLLPSILTAACHQFLTRFWTQLETRPLSASTGLRSMKVSNAIFVSSPISFARYLEHGLMMSQLGS